MRKFQHGRHTTAFVLLFLADAPAYGGLLLKRLEDSLPANTIDSAILYRTLKQLEKEGAIRSYVNVLKGNKPMKYYELTEEGMKLLDEFYDDILLRQQNLAYFLNHYQQLKEKKHE